MRKKQTSCMQNRRNSLKNVATFVPLMLSLVIASGCSHQKQSLSKKGEAQRSAELQKLRLLHAQTVSPKLLETRRRLDIALSATNWRVAKQPHCLDDFFPDIARLDRSFQNLLTREGELDAWYEDPIFNENDNLNSIKAKEDSLLQSIGNYEAELGHYVERAMNPSTRCNV